MAIPKYISANRKQFLYTLCFQLSFFAIGVVMVLLINRFINEERDYACMGTLMALCGILAGGFMQANIASFRLVVMMGRTRRYYLLFSPLVTALLTIQGWLTAICLYKAENLLYSILYPGYESELPIEIVFKWWVVALSVVIFSIVCLFFGAVQVKFGAKGAMTLWLIFCFSCMLLPQSVERYQSGGASPLAKLGGLLLVLVELLTPAMWIGAGVTALLAALAFSVWAYLGAEVRM